MFSEGTDCGTLQAPRNGEVDLIGTIAGSTAIYSCNEGFTLEGARFRECLESGEWSEEEPDCQGKCPAQLNIILHTVVIKFELYPSPRQNESALWSISLSFHTACRFPYMLVTN